MSSRSFRPRSSLVRSTLASALLAAAAAGCSAQAGPDYQGETLATIHGSVVNDLGHEVGALEATLLWSFEDETGADTAATDAVSVTGSFPASFQLELFGPPDDAHLIDLTRGGERPTESRIGVALITALPPGFAEAEEDPEGPVGASEKHMLVYVESAIQPGTEGAAFVGELEAGYHLMEVIDAADPSCGNDTFDCLRVAPDGFDTQIEVRIDEPEALDVPEWS